MVQSRKDRSVSILSSSSYSERRRRGTGDQARDRNGVDGRGKARLLSYAAGRVSVLIEERRRQVSREVEVWWYGKGKKVKGKVGGWKNGWCVCESERKQ